MIKTNKLISYKILPFMLAIGLSACGVQSIQSHQSQILSPSRDSRSSNYNRTCLVSTFTRMNQNKYLFSFKNPCTASQNVSINIDAYLIFYKYESGEVKGSPMLKKQSLTVVCQNYVPITIFDSESDEEQAIPHQTDPLKLTEECAKILKNSGINYSYTSS